MKFRLFNKDLAKSMATCVEIRTLPEFYERVAKHLPTPKPLMWQERIEVFVHKPHIDTDTGWPMTYSVTVPTNDNSNFDRLLGYTDQPLFQLELDKNIHAMKRLIAKARQHMEHGNTPALYSTVEEMSRFMRVPEHLDKCQICYGACGGVPGNENRIAGILMCDYCSVDFGKNVQ